ncbi:MAG: TIGR03757 family integrating conjugative element protein [Micavibrio sp.]|nr:TIGR03757 family integrating conjugative element protein [Micavibrio sp.]
MKALFPLKTVLLIAILFANEHSLARDIVLPHSIIVITSDKRPIKNSDAVKHRLHQAGGTLAIYNLDAVQSFENIFSKNLPANEEAARKLFEKRMQKYGPKQFEKAIVQAYKGLFSALVYHVDRYPVIIFNKTEAIYGITDLKAALAMYQAWRLTQNEHR